MRTKYNDSWDHVITSKSGWWDVDVIGIWRYRYLIYMYVKRDFIITYKQTILGPLWFIISPIFTIIIYMFIFGGIAGLSTEGIPQPLFYMAGILLWNYFSDCFGASNNVFVSNAQVFSKVWFPRLVVPVSGCISSLIKTGIQAILFIVIYIFCAFSNPSLKINWIISLVPFLVMMLALHGMSWGLIVSSITYKYRDLQMLIGFLFQFFMYVTPVVYPLEAIPNKYKHIVMLNPLSSIFETFKYGCFSVGVIDWWGLLYSVLFLIIILFFSILIFNRVGQYVIDTV